MLKIGSKIQVVVKHMDEQGMGIVYVQRDKIIIRNVIMHEKVEIEIIKRLKNAYVGNIVKIIQPSSVRVESPCPYANQCGGCQLLHMNYPAQLKLKKQMIVDVMQKEQLALRVQDVIGQENPYAYRNKIIISFSRNKKGMIAGFYEEYSHKIIPIKGCLMHESYVNKMIEDIQTIMKKCKIEAYDEDSRRGYLRHILIRRAVESNETMLTLVVTNKVFKAKNQFLKELKDVYPEVKNVVLNVNSRSTSVVLSKEEYVILGKGYIEDILCGKKFKISSQSFYQINHEQCEKLYTKALSLLDLKGYERVIDAYCGIGTIGMICSPNVKEVSGVEVNAQAVKDAVYNKKLNQMNNIQFVCEDASTYMSMLAKRRSKIDVVIMDPARDGSNEMFLSSLCQLRPKQVLYISCNPITQIRDIKYLLKKGYQAKEMFLFDLFPNTFHIESIVLLQRS